MLPLKSPRALGAVLRETRTALRIPAEDLAAMVETSPVTLRRLEQGNPTAAIKTLFSLLDELGLELQVSLPPGVGPLILPDEKSKPRRTRVRP
jgi:transcriptional regulator with XRE-family HTH domain